MLGEDEKKKLIQDFNVTESEYPKDRLMVELFKEQVAKAPKKIAVVDQYKQLTFEDLDKKSDQLAELITKKGIEEEGKIGVMLSKGISMIVAILAILKAKAAYVSLNPKLPQARKDYIIADCLIKCVIRESEGQLVLESQENQFENSYKGNVSSPLAYVLYSSGSTGTPKGILIEQQGIVRLVKNSNFMSFLETDRVLSTCPLDFDVSSLEIWGCLLNGSTLYLVDENDVLMTDRMEQILFKSKINKLWLSTPLFNAWVNENIGLFKEIEYLIVGGDVLSPTLVQKVKTTYPKLKFVNGYGPTENSVISTYFDVLDASYKRIPIGKPISNSTAYIVSSAGEIQPVGAVGEIWLGGNGVGRAYQNKPDLSHNKFADNPFGKGRIFKSGDMGRWLSDGSIDFLGRKDFQVKVRGYRIEIPEVELAIKSHSAVTEAVVIVMDKGEQGKELIGYFQLQAGVFLPDMRTFLANLIPQYCIPSHFIPLDIFPLTPTGKIDRNKLKERGTTIIQKEAQKDFKTNSNLEETLLKIYSKVLQKSFLGVRDNFFDLGGNSLHTIQIRSLIQKELKRQIPITDIFQYPTVAELAHYLQDDSGNDSLPIVQGKASHKEDIAIIGLSGRFPGADTIQQYWQNLSEGRQSIKQFSIEELLEEGIPEDLILQDRYVRAKGSLNDIEHFDHHFFGYSEREAEMMDPQMRLLHECCWEVLEDGGYVPESYKGKIGLFVGSEVNIGWIDSLLQHIQDPTELWQAAHYNAHSIATPVSYKLKLTGPSLTIDTACSSSLVAIHQAKQSLIAGECDMAIAGGVSIELPKKAGYLYEEGMIRSRDGRCRAFDSDASGTVSGDGIGMVLLKPLSQALKDKDHVYAILKGSAINNDGDRKVGYTAPSVSGQSEVIQMALSDAGISPKDLSYVEAHGTGTKLGDPVEVKALSRAYSLSNKHSIGIGSVKTNIGHLNTAAGVAGFIKTALALQHQFIPPSLNYEKENQECHFSETPFKVIGNGQKWAGNSPKRAGVSSFGIGGTNAHIILEEFPLQKNSQDRSKEDIHLCIFSAKSRISLKKKIHIFRESIKHNNDSLEDICYTLQVGRKHFEYRAALLCTKKIDVVSALNQQDLDCHLVAPNKPPNVAFVFSWTG